MLDDTARKLLRIMVQFNGHFHRMPALDELRRLSGRRPAAMKAGMLQLVEQYYIQWDAKQLLRGGCNIRRMGKGRHV
jgi:hypothetical protein